MLKAPARFSLLSAAVVAAAGVLSFLSTADAAVRAQSKVPAVKYVVASSGNEVRYRIQEHLVRMTLPNDAVGATTEIGGGIAFASDGSVVPSESKFLIKIGSLTSDRDMRDNFVRRRVLEADQYPTVEFAPTAAKGLGSTLPTSGTHEFQLVGNLTVHGVTKPTTWNVKATMANGQVTGNAATAFTFDQFGLAQPKVPIVLSVGDTIRLEYDFTLVPKQL
jgi:polyisoprenoid-binding protein YceI